MSDLFPTRARWIWDGSDRAGYHYYLRARKTFRARTGEPAALKITADANYQVWLNGQIVGHGPAKSAEGRRSVDTYEITSCLVNGENQLDILVLSIGVGTMTYCLAPAGLIFAIQLPGRLIVSDATTLVQRDRGRTRPTVRRWMMPCIEDVDAGAAVGRWQRATVVPKVVTLYPRRVPLPSRSPVLTERVVATERVRLPNFSISFRLRSFLVEEKDRRRCNNFATPARLVLTLDSPVAQTLRFTPTLGSITWRFNGRKLFTGSGWQLWNPAKSHPVIRLKKGRNELVGEHGRNHFDDASLASYVERPVRVAGLSVNGKKVPVMTDANAHDLAVGAEVDRRGPVRRTIYDLGAVRNGWLAFDVHGRRGTRLILTCFEGLDEGPPRRIQWANACNNALTYRLRDGWQSYESFFPYGVRYIAVDEVGGPVQLKNLRVLSANCGSQPQGYFRCDNALLNAVYEMCVQSLISSVDDTFTDCPTFEQVNWNCDNRWASECDYLTCANHAVVRNSIELFAEDPGYPGLVRSQYPSAWDNQIPLWSFHWIMWCRDYYRHTADRAFVQRLFPRLRAGIEDGLRKLGPRGLLEWNNVWHFVDWGHGRDDDHAIMSAEQAGFVGALLAAEELAHELGQGDVARWRNARVRLVRAINAQLWDERKQAYVDSLHADGQPSRVSSQITNAMMIVYDVASGRRRAQLARRVARGDRQLLPYGSAFGAYYLMEVLDEVGDVPGLFRCIGQKWGDMVRAGDRTTWEMFAEFGHGTWPTRSRCHPYATYVYKFFVRYLLGIECVSPGFRTFRVRPRPPAGIEQCQGAIPTPHGLIRVGWQRHGARLNLKVEIPKGARRI